MPRAWTKLVRDVAMTDQDAQGTDSENELVCSGCAGPIAGSVKPVFGAKRSQITTLLGNPWEGIDTEEPLPFHPWHVPPDDSRDWVRIR